MGEERTGDHNRVGVLDGIRALAVLMVVWFHFWQQSWLMPIGFGVNADWLPRTGYEMVDMLLLISGFCLFLPHARIRLSGGAPEKPRRFYLKRLARILPSYLFSILVALLVFAVPMNAYGSAGELFKDLFTHLTFTHTFFPETYMGTKLNVVLWTLAVEMQFYLIFPFLAARFRKNPLAVYGVLVGISLVFNTVIVLNRHRLPFSMLMNQLPAFLCVYANGMMGALVYEQLKTRPKSRNGVWQTAKGWLFTLGALACLPVYWLLMLSLSRSGEGQAWQVRCRYEVSVVFVLFILCSAFAVKAFQGILSNGFTRFFSSISLNLYIWHQFIAVKLKEFRIPPWSGEKPPNQTGDAVWMWQYFILCCVLSLLAAAAATYFIEKPAQRWILKRFGTEKGACKNHREKRGKARSYKTQTKGLPRT